MNILAYISNCVCRQGHKSYESQWYYKE